MGSSEPEPPTRHHGGSQPTLRKMNKIAAKAELASTRFVHVAKCLMHCIMKRLRVAGATGTFSERSVGDRHNWDGCASEGCRALSLPGRELEHGLNPPGDLAIKRHQPGAGRKIQRVPWLTLPGEPETLHWLA